LRRFSQLYFNWILSAGFFGAAIVGAQSSTTDLGPARLQVDRLQNPLGIDDSAPSFSWILLDPAHGARQIAYEIQVASDPNTLNSDKADVWSSGKTESNSSLNVRYAGPSLEPSRRYFWRVKAWGTGDKLYPVSKTSWWETGLLSKDGGWHSNWIGYETSEESAVRRAPAEWVVNPDAEVLASEKASEQHFAYRYEFAVSRPIRNATLFATGQDSVSAWVNGVRVMVANPLPPWKQMPWKKFVSADVTGKLAQGANTLAIEAVHYLANPNGAMENEAPPMIATLFLEFEDGSTGVFTSGPSWKTAIHAPVGWEQKGFDDSSWKSAAVFRTPKSGPMSSPPGHPWIPDAVKAMRTSFEVENSIRSARLYATALGTYEVFLNGKSVGDARFAPGWTDYREHVMYQTYDVTGLLSPGHNAIAVLLAPGWYSTPLEWFQQPNNYGDTPPAFRAQLRIEYNDGSVKWVQTDDNWLAHTSEILHSELYDGETQDARQRIDGWKDAEFDSSHWSKAAVIKPAAVLIEGQDFPPIRPELTLDPKSVAEPRPGVYVFDFGQNLVGVERLRVQGPAGTDVRVRFSEILNDDGTLYTDNLRTAKATDHFILNGKGIEEFTPEFTFHGFRYAEITGLPTAPTKDAITAIVLHTGAAFTSKLSTGSELIDKLWSNILWGQRSNFVGVPTDCPQRDERLGWMADAQVFWRAASYNMDLASFSKKFAADMRGTQSGTSFYGIYAPGTSAPNTGFGAGWSDAGVVIPWTSWLQTGDRAIIDQNWPSMEKYLNGIADLNPSGLWEKQNGIPFGDWLSPEGKTDYVLIATAYWAYDVSLMRQMALATGRTDDAERYAKSFEKIRTAFQKKFVREDGFVAGADNTPSPFGQINNPNAKSSGGDTQTGYVLALHMNLLPDDLRARAAQRLVDKIEANRDLLGTGFLGTPYLLEELAKTGHAALAYKLLLNTDYPSWGYLVGHGATTMWERWNGDQMKGDPSMNSYNHYAYGAVADWIYRYAAGVDATPLDAGFHTIVLHPVFDSRLGSAAFDYDSAYGTIHSSWTVKNSNADWHLTLPANTTGWLEVKKSDAVHYKIDGIAISASNTARAATHDGKDGFELASGQYTFEVAMN
jgi:alpha-L-rhamnosidase